MHEKIYRDLVAEIDSWRNELDLALLFRDEKAYQEYANVPMECFLDLMGSMDKYQVDWETFRIGMLFQPGDPAAMYKAALASSAPALFDYATGTMILNRFAPKMNMYFKKARNEAGKTFDTLGKQTLLEYPIDYGAIEEVFKRIENQLEVKYPDLLSDLSLLNNLIK